MSQFHEGDRVFSHYVGCWGTVLRETHSTPPTTHGVTGDPLPGSTWYEVEMDSGSRERLDDADGNWELARLLPPEIAAKYGWPRDPQAV